MGGCSIVIAHGVGTSRIISPYPMTEWASGGSYIKVLETLIMNFWLGVSIVKGTIRLTRHLSPPSQLFQNS